MSKDIEVILLEDIDELGTAGDIVSVSEGYARKSLFPEGLAALATQSHFAKASRDKARQESLKQDELRALQDKASALDGTELVIEAEVKDGNEIYGSIGQQEVCKELKSQAGLTCKAKDITMAAPLTSLGSEDVSVSLGEGIEATVRVTIAAAAGPTSSEDEEE